MVKQIHYPGDITPILPSGKMGATSYGLMWGMYQERMIRPRAVVRRACEPYSELLHKMANNHTVHTIYAVGLFYSIINIK